MTNKLFQPAAFDNCFSAAQLDAIKLEIHKEQKCISYVHDWEGEHFGKTLSVRHQGNWQNNELQKLVLAGLPKAIADNMLVESIAHLQSFIPYEFHCDYGHVKCDNDEMPFLVIIIPLETVDARTMVLDQTMQGLHFVDYKKDASPLPLDQQLSFDEYGKYFSHCWAHERPYISIKNIFNWQAGTAFAIDLQYIHASDNFLKNNLTEKNCITMFTKIKKENYQTVCDMF